MENMTSEYSLNSFESNNDLEMEIQAPETTMQETSTSTFQFNIIPTASPMIFTLSTYVNSFRTTNCDIMCTLSTAIHGGDPPSKFKQVAVTLPYKKQHNITSDAKGTTPFQKLKLAEAHKKKNDDLYREHAEFFNRLNREKQRKQVLERAAVIKIQAIARGFLVRPRVAVTKKAIKNPSLSEMHDELCNFASKLGLRPIPGLNLEARSKASKRRIRIENAAAYRIQRFFQMIVARNLAQRRMNGIRIEKKNKAAICITRFFRYIIVRNFSKKCEASKKYQAAIVIQCAIRKCLSVMKTHLKRKTRIRRRQIDEASIIIQRSLKLKLRLKAMERKEQEMKEALRLQMEEMLRIEAETERMVDLVVSMIMDEMSEQLVMNNAIDIQTDIYLETLRRIEEERRRLEEERRALEEALAREEAIRAEQERLEKERLEKERIENERKEKERLEKEQQERERLERERIERERLEQERLEKERIERERLHQIELQENEIADQSVNFAMQNIMELTVIRGVAMVTAEIGDSLAGYCSETAKAMVNQWLRTAETQIMLSMAADKLVDLVIAKASESAANSVKSVLVAAFPSSEAGVEGDVDDGMSELSEDRDDAETRLMRVIQNLDAHITSAGRLKLSGNYADALRLLESQLEALSSPLLPTSPSTQAEVLSGLGDVHAAMAHFDRAQEYLDKALLAAQQTPGPRGGFQAAGICSQLGEVYRIQARFEVAKESYAKALTAMKSHVAATESKNSNNNDGDTANNKENENNEERIASVYVRTLVGIATLQRDEGSYSKCLATLKKVRAISSHHGLDDLAKASFLSIQASLFDIGGLVGPATALLQEAADLYRVRVSPQAPPVATTLCELAAIALNKGDLVDADRLISDAMSMRQAFLEEGHPDMAAVYHLRGCLRRDQGRFAEAFKDLQLALDWRRRLFGEDHPSLSQSFVALADAFRSAGIPQRSVDCITQAAVVQGHWPRRAASVSLPAPSTSAHSPLLGPLTSIAPSADCIDLLLSRAALSLSSGRPRDGLALLSAGRTACEAMQTALQADHLPRREMCQLLTAQALTELEGFDVAKPLIAAFGKAMTQLYGKGHCSVAQGLLVLGDFCHRRGRFADAKASYSKALAVVVQQLGDRHPRALPILIASARNAAAPGYYEEAAPLVELAIVIARDLNTGEQSLYTAQAVACLANISRDVGHYMEARKHYQRALSMFESLLGVENLYYGSCFADFGECLRRDQDLDESHRVLTEAVEILQSQLGQTNSQVAAARLSLGMLAMDRRDLETARTVISEQVIGVLEKSVGNHHPLTHYAKANLGLVLNAMHQAKGLKAMIDENGKAASLPGQAAIDSCLEFLDVYKQGVFADNHPWVVRLGGFDAESMTSLGSRRGSKSKVLEVDSSAVVAMDALPNRVSSPELIFERSLVETNPQVL